ncbi:mtd1, partial [Symbiodinium sp. CCMP2456]
MADAPELAAGARKVLADEVAAPFREEIRKAVADMGGVGPKLVGFLANADPAAKKYAEWTGKAMTADNLRFELRQVEEGSLEDELEKANKEPDVDGIMIYYPVFGQRPSFHGGSHDDYLRDTVSPYKDAEGLNHFYRRALYRNKRSVDSAGSKKCVLPCTPLAV